MDPLRTILCMAETLSGVKRVGLPTGRTGTSAMSLWSSLWRNLRSLKVCLNGAWNWLESLLTAFLSARRLATMASWRTFLRDGEVVEVVSLIRVLGLSLVRTIQV